MYLIWHPALSDLAGCSRGVKSLCSCCWHHIFFGRREFIPIMDSLHERVGEILLVPKSVPLLDFTYIGCKEMIVKNSRDPVGKISAVCVTTEDADWILLSEEQNSFSVRAGGPAGFPSSVVNTKACSSISSMSRYFALWRTWEVSRGNSSKRRIRPCASAVSRQNRSLAHRQCFQNRLPLRFDAPSLIIFRSVFKS